ncbi:hypothetical protein L218DRAFT_951641 [Marasmius fiardii PR-910]|nr:hypothetical protein L218DRAFT_951641 [Marasmius fiardii PR-910]
MSSRDSAFLTPTSIIYASSSPLQTKFLEPRFSTKDNVMPKVRCTHCNTTPDVFFLTSDGLFLGAHETNLRLYSGNLSWYTDYHIDQRLRIISIPGFTRDIFDILLSFTHPHFTNDEAVGKSSVNKLPFRDLVNFAYAAEKFQVWLGLRVARISVGEYAQHYPQYVFGYYVWHYRDLDPLYPIIPRALSRVPKERMEGIQRCNPLFYQFWELLKTSEF